MKQLFLLLILSLAACGEQTNEAKTVFTSKQFANSISVNDMGQGFSVYASQSGEPPQDGDKIFAAGQCQSAKLYIYADNLGFVITRGTEVAYTSSIRRMANNNFRFSFCDATYLQCNQPNAGPLLKTVVLPC